MSETKNLKLKKHDNVETNTKKFDIENYLNGNWDKIEDYSDKIDTQISNIQEINKEQSQKLETKVDKVSGKGLSTNDFTNEYKSKLDKLQNYDDSEVKNEITEIQNKDTAQDNKISQLETEKANLETELKEAQEDFYQSSIRGQASGEYIHVEDSSGARCKIGIYGNSEQDGEPSPGYSSEIKTVGSQGSVKVTKCNKNILKNDLINQTKNGIKVIHNEDDSLTVEGTSTAITDIRINGDWYNKNKILTLKKGKQYGILGTSSRSDGYYIIVNGLDHKTILRSTTNNSDSSIITTEDTDIYDIYLHIEKDVTVKNIIYPMITEGIPNKYEQHEEQSYIMPVQSEMLKEDYFDFDNEEEVHTWNKLTLNGTENWVQYGKYKEGYLYYVDGLIDAYTNNIDHMGVGLCTHFSWDNSSSLFPSIRCQYDNGKRLYIGLTENLSLSDFKTWLKSQYDAGTPVVIYYKQATPTRLKFTDEQKSVAKELNNARTYKNVTNITTDSKAIIDLDYVKDAEVEHNKMQNEIDEIKQLLSTTQTSALLLDNLQKEVESEVE